jgi:uncharacterized protein YcnI
VDDATAGASDVAVTFRVPNEVDDAATTRLEVHLPADHPLLDVLLPVHPGWTGKATIGRLPKPLRYDDEVVTEAVTVVVWTANAAADGVQPGQSADFVLTAGLLPETPSLTFKALQTYSDGHVVRWIDQPSGDDDAGTPAPTVVLAPQSTHGAARTAQLLGGAGLATSLVAVVLVGLTVRRLRTAG